MEITIGRTSGPVTDRETSTEVTPEELETFKDVLAMVNRVTGCREGWFVRLPDGSLVVPLPSNS